MKGTTELAPRQQLVLAFLGAGDGEAVDPIRIMKGLFVFTQEAPEDWMPKAERYEFVPYDYGPCAFAVYSDLELLQALSYVKAQAVDGQSWSRYSLTPSGAEASARLTDGAWPAIRTYLGQIREFLRGLPFHRLLPIIYRKYPDYAVNSIFKS